MLVDHAADLLGAVAVDEEGLLHEGLQLLG
jgi:hypothetical protein